ncbi:MAG: hypothetical protein LKI28_01190 [Ancrocorticia sp.]|jgi:chromosome segregation ATPase|nr:hypothetical protein [Ancrocorticia sp.]
MNENLTSGHPHEDSAQALPTRSSEAQLAALKNEIEQVNAQNTICEHVVHELTERLNDLEKDRNTALQNAKSATERLDGSVPSLDNMLRYYAHKSSPTIAFILNSAATVMRKILNGTRSLLTRIRG